MAEATEGAGEARAKMQDAPSLWTKLAYGYGAAAYGVKDNGFSYFLLFFYSVVIGLDARLVGLALTVALVLDALSDPVVGYWSDNFRSRWGRRHPFMYFSAIPLAATYFLIWTPPDWSHEALFWYLLILAVLIRTFITFYETPSTALAPELASDYDQRSSLLSYRFYFAWTIGNLMSALMLFVIYPAHGRLDRESYALYGVTAAVLIVTAVLVSSVGTHGSIARLRPAPPRRSLTLAKIFKEVFETLANRSFAAIFGAAVFAAIAQGLSAALAFPILFYFWGFSDLQSGLAVLGVFGSAVIGSLLAPVVTRRLGKKRGAIIVGLIAFTGSPLPIFLKLMGWLPNDPQFVFWFVFIAGMIDVGLIICFQVLFTAMIADLVEQAELKTGRRSEGVFFAAVTFTRKAVQGIGIIAAGFVLALAQFPAGVTDSAQVTPEAAMRLGAYYAPTILALWLAMIMVLSAYKLNRRDHEQNLRKLAGRDAS